MDLKQRSVDGLMSQLIKDCTVHQSGPENGRTAAVSLPHKALVESLRQLNCPVIVVVDEVDQLVKRGARASSFGALNDLLALPQQAGLETVAVVMIANAVDLLDRTGVPLMRDGAQGCSSLLFEPYTADQLRQIVKARLGGTEVERVTMEVRVRQVAKSSGDCRQALSICEEAIQKKADAGDGTPVKLGMKSSKMNPLSAVQSLPVEQQVLLSALTGSKSEAAMRVPAVCSLYKDICRKLRQPVSLASKGHVSNVLSLLEQRGLLSRWTMKVKVGKGKAGSAETVVELAVARDQVRQRLPAFLQLQ
jgi:Cdc6-like AAA superfamily ATPase